MSNPELRAGLFCAPMLQGTCAGISSYAPSPDVYGSYFPAWLICLMVGVILTIGVRLNENVIQWGTLSIKGALIAIEFVLITSCALDVYVMHDQPLPSSVS